MFQHTGQELADNLKKCMASALKKFHQVNGALPERIIVYRDGVGDGQVFVHMYILAYCVEFPIVTKKRCMGKLVNLSEVCTLLQEKVAPLRWQVTMHHHVDVVHAYSQVCSARATGLTSRECSTLKRLN